MTIEELQNKITDAENIIVRANVALEAIRLEIAKLKREGDTMSLKVRTPDGNTPINTICTRLGCLGLPIECFWKGKGVDEQFIVANSPLGKGERVPGEITINTVEDLRFRMFLNAPAEYKWGTIDEDGKGYVYASRPVWNGNEWFYNDGDYLLVGIFKQYADEWDKILVERDDT